MAPSEITQLTGSREALLIKPPAPPEGNGSPEHFIICDCHSLRLHHSLLGTGVGLARALVQFDLYTTV